MKKRFTEEQIIGFLKEAEAGAFSTVGIADMPIIFSHLKEQLEVTNDRFALAFPPFT